MLTAAAGHRNGKRPSPRKAAALIAKEAQLLLRAIPSKAWFDALEPSLAVRAGKACIGIATIADETDLALSLLSDAVARTPDQAVPIADEFLKTWEMRLSPKSDIDEDAYMYYFWREAISQAPLTRGRQRRNLDRLSRLMDTLRGTGIDLASLAGHRPGLQGLPRHHRGLRHRRHPEGLSTDRPDPARQLLPPWPRPWRPA